MSSDGDQWEKREGKRKGASEGAGTVATTVARRKDGHVLRAPLG